MLDISVNWIESNGFRRYLIVTGKDTIIGDNIYPPSGTTEVIMGCGPNNKIGTILQLAAIMTPSELFDLKYYQEWVLPTTAKPVRNFYAYHSTSLWDPIGFTANVNIHLGSSWDQYDCREENRCEVGDADNHRLSILLGMLTILEMSRNAVLRIR